MRILIGCLAWRLGAETTRRIFTQDWDHPVDVLFLQGDDARPGESRFAAVTRKYQTLRDRFLAGPYDALLTVEDDMLIPRNAIKDLEDCESDIAYGLYVWRYESQHWWSAHPKLRIEDDQFKFWSLSNAPEIARRHWGARVKVEGLGLGCTLIRRGAVAALPFRRPDDGHCNDTYLAIDAQAAGLSQVCNTAVICGHKRSDGAIVWPDIDYPELYRVDQP